MIERSFKIGVNAGFSVAPVVHVNQYDHDEVWYFTLVQEDGQVYAPSTGSIVGVKADGNVIINSGTVNSSGQIVINETQQMTAAVGNAVYELVFDAGTHGTANFIVRVEPKPGDNATVSDSDISLIEEAIVMGSRIVAYGSPLVATTASQMTSRQNVYVYTGSESGYTNGHWYYWNGSAWTDGGVYNAVAVNTDKTLSVENMAADGKATGDAIADLKNALNDVKNLDDFNILAGIQWENKSVNTTNGAEFDSSTRILSDFIDVSNVSKIKVSVNNGYRYIYHLYDENKNWLSYHGGWQTASQTISPSSPYIKFVVSKTNDAQISPSESINFYAEGMLPFNDFVNNVSATFESLSFNTPIMRDGTIGNTSNVNGITTEYVIPIPKRYDFVMVEWTGYDITENEDVGFGYCVYDGASDGMTSTEAFTSSAVTNHNHNSGLTELTDIPPIKYISLDDLRAEGQHYGICVFRKKNGSFVPLRIATAQYSLKITYGYYENSNTDTSIIALNPDARGNLLQANRPINASANSYLSVAQPVTLLHFSDIHADSVELKRMVEFLDRYSSLIDNAICTGDMANQRYSDGMAWWSNVDGAEKILLAIGNHDALADPSGYDWTQLATQAQQYSQYFSPYISNWGVTYTVNKTYYYKDYSAKKIRLVVLNCMLTGADNTEQLTWLTNTLASAKTSGLSVVIAVHYMPYNPQKIDCNFSTLDRGVGNDVLSLPYLTAVQDFVADGGEFICYIAGHVHYDIFVKSASYPNQMCICIDALNVYQSNVYSDTQRTKGTKSQDLANLITFDTASKVVKITRVGADQDHYLRSKKFMTFKYLTGDIITEN